MPYIGELDGERVYPSQVEDDAAPSCLDCDGEMIVVSRHMRGDHFVSRHFRHANDGDCGGESRIHVKMKEVAKNKAEELWDAEAEIEARVGERRADVLVQGELDWRWGVGLAIECQHKNTSKDVETWNRDLWERGYSVLWVNTSHLDGHDLALRDGDWKTVWPNAVPVMRQWSGVVDGSQPTHTYRSLGTQPKVIACFPVEWFKSDIRSAFKLGGYKKESGGPERRKSGKGKDKVDCPSCGHTHVVTPLARGEIHRGMTCRDCGSWFSMCPECFGELIYTDQSKDGRGDFVSEYECTHCGNMALRR